MENQKIAEKLYREGIKVEQYFAGLSGPRIRIDVYQEGQSWQIRDVLAHFISAESSFLKLFENIRNGGGGSPEDFSINEYNDSNVLKMRQIAFEKLITLFHETRSQTVEWLKSISEDDFEIIGRHPAMGVVSLGEMVKMIYIHNQMHLRDIRIAIDAVLNDNGELAGVENTDK